MVEGERFGVLALGLTLDEVRSQFAHSFRFASPESGNPQVDRYTWQDTTGSWQVFADKESTRVVALMFFAPFTFGHETYQEHEQRLGRIPFQTSRGVRFGHGVQTIETVYGKPGKMYRRSNRVVTYYYPQLRTEFLLGCPMVDVSKPCEDYDLTVEQIRIYAREWSPERLWGEEYAR